jgi:hypothetical protein
VSNILAGAQLDGACPNRLRNLIDFNTDRLGPQSFRGNKAAL